MSGFRDPYVVVESLYHFLLAIFPGVQLQQGPVDFTRGKGGRFYRVAMQSYFKAREDFGSALFYEIKMEEFMKDKIGSLRKLYDALNISGFEKAVPAFEKFLSGNPREKHAYEIHPETIHYVNEMAADIVKQLGYHLRSE